MTHMRNGSMKAAEMEPFYILVREEKASRIPHRHSKARGHRPEVRVSRGGRQTTSSIILVLYPAYSGALIGIARLQSPKSHSPVRRTQGNPENCAPFHCCVLWFFLSKPPTNQAAGRFLMQHGVSDTALRSPVGTPHSEGAAAGAPSLLQFALGHIHAGVVPWIAQSKWTSQPPPRVFQRPGIGWIKN